MDNHDELTKSLVSLIDETLEEIEELKKSRFSAAECQIGEKADDFSSKNAGADADKNGSLGKEEREEEDEKAEEAEKAEEDEEDEEAEKAEEDEEDEEAEKAKKSKVAKMDGDVSAPDMAMQSPAAAGVNTIKAEPVEGYDIKKSEEETEELFKSYVDARINPLEERLTVIQSLIEKIADQPVSPKGVTSNMVPLTKSSEEEAITKWDKGSLSGQLMELKKSGKEVDGLDFTKIDLGANLGEIAAKYGLN